MRFSHIWLQRPARLLDGVLLDLDLFSVCEINMLGHGGVHWTLEYKLSWDKSLVFLCQALETKSAQIPPKSVNGVANDTNPFVRNGSSSGDVTHFAWTLLSRSATRNQLRLDGTHLHTRIIWRQSAEFLANSTCQLQLNTAWRGLREWFLKVA